ncbi:MAG: hypothetical protein R8K49_01615, partial [Mariprofundaceae bacterium]
MPDSNPLPYLELQLTDLKPQHLSALSGPANQNLKRIEKALSIKLSGPAGNWKIQGLKAQLAADILRELSLLCQH